jgi:thioesterase domain-containing protein
MFDTHLSLKHFEMLNLDDQSVIRWIAPHLNVPMAELKKLPLEQQWERIAQEANLADGVGVAEIRRLAAVCKAHLAAASHYEPQTYAGAVVLFQARESGGGRDRRWKALCPQVRIERVPGNHYSMLRKPHVDQLAARLGQLLAQASKATAERRQA